MKKLELSLKMKYTTLSTKRNFMKRKVGYKKDQLNVILYHHSYATRTRLILFEIVK